MPEPSRYEPITIDNIDQQVGIVRDFFRKRLEDNDDEPLVEDDDLPVKQRYPKHYPLALLSDCASDSPQILPSFSAAGAVAACQQSTQGPDKPLQPETSPPTSWFAACFLLTAMCFLHIAGLYSANLWSPLTRDMAIDTNDEPRRRAVYIHIGTTMLFCMCFVTAYPIFPLLQETQPVETAVRLAVVTILSGVAALILSLNKTWRYSTDLTLTFRAEKSNDPRSEAFRSNMTLYHFFHIVAIVAGILVVLAWIHNCGAGLASAGPTYERLFFSYRSLHLLSGVAPSLPILLLLSGWYLWSIVQTRRMRFSRTSRPRLPGGAVDMADRVLFVTDDALDEHLSPTNRRALFENITCLLITGNVAVRLFRKYSPRLVSRCLYVVYAALILLFTFLWRIDSPERMFWIGNHASWHRYLPTTYEALTEILFLPLMVIAVTAWLRMMLIWNSLSTGILRPLDEMPLRFAFSRLEGLGWMALMRQSGFVQRRRETARSLEAMRQMMHVPELAAAYHVECEGRDRYESMLEDIKLLLSEMDSSKSDARQLPNAKCMSTQRALFRSMGDVPHTKFEEQLFLIHRVEMQYADFARALLDKYLLAFWKDRQVAPVDRRGEMKPEGSSSDSVPPTPWEPKPPQLLAEEFLAIRYLSLIRAVLVNIRELMTLIVSIFMISIVAWNSYQFRPREWVDAALTAMLIILGSGIVWVLAQIHRDPILSRVTRTTANELGVDFYIRVLTFGAVPLLTWVAYQFPSVSNGILKYVQPGIEAVK